MVLGADGMDALHRSHVAVFGLGGVGSYAVETLVRSGVGELTLIDDDTVALTNLNRQLEALHSTLGQSKAEAIAARCRDINPAVVLHPIVGRYEAAGRERFFDAKYDYILDCIDLVSCKLDLIETALTRGIPILSALGTGNKLDPSQLQITDISKTYGCPLARVMRKELKARGILHTRVLFSPELPAATEQKETPPPGRGRFLLLRTGKPHLGPRLRRTDDGRRSRARPRAPRKGGGQMMLLGSLVNMLAIFAGCFVGVTLGRFIPERFNSAIEKGIALCVFYIGLDGVLAGSDTLVAILSMVLGVILGELLDLDGRIHALGDWVERRFAKKQSKTSISEGFVNASLLFCVGAMAIMGALDSGLTGDHATLYAKSTLDGITSIVYGSTMGVGVALSGVAVFLYQGLITLCASFIAPFLSDVVIAEMKCVGSLLIIGLSFNMLGMTKIKVMNYVPAVFFPILLCTFM